MEAKDIELFWAGKQCRPSREPCVLVERPEESYPDPAGRPATDTPHCDNRLIWGDNLQALQLLQPEFAEHFQCVYIDPPYNTGLASAAYDDRLTHSAWLSFMRDRLELLHALLRPGGVLFVSIDDTELAYLTLVLDEIFGRHNFCGPLVWEKKRKPSFLNANLGSVTEYILAYAKDRSQSPAFIGGVTTAGKKYPLNNAGNGLRTLTFPAGAVQFGCHDQVFPPQDMSAGNIVTRLLDRLVVRGGTNVAAFRLEGEWRYSQRRLDALVAAGERLVIRKAPFRPNHIKVGGAPKKLKNLLSVAHYGMSTYEDAAEESRRLFGDERAFAYPKPERLIQTLLAAVTRPGDWVLDSFAGSGTTGAVAHKMRRNWVLVERGPHCRSHIVPRLRKVIDGEDPGGVTGSANWQGGGAFRFFEVHAQ